MAEMIVPPVWTPLDSDSPEEPEHDREQTAYPAMTRITEDVPEVDEPEVSLGDRAAAALLDYREGRHDALAAFVREATPLLWHTARAQGVDRELADDVVQNAWMALVRSAHTIQEPHAVLKWLLVTVKRGAWESVRKQRDDQKRRTELPDDLFDGPMGTLPSSGPTPEAQVLEVERDRSLWRAVLRLPDRCQQLLRLISLADRPDYKYISSAIGMPVGSIGSNRGRCLAKLRDIIESEQGDGTWETP